MGRTRKCSAFAPAACRSIEAWRRSRRRMADALVVIDMQVAGFPPGVMRQDADGVIERINALARWVRARRGLVVWVQHDGPKGDPFEPETPGWAILPSLDRRAGDETVRKT